MDYGRRLDGQRRRGPGHLQGAQRQPGGGVAGGAGRGRAKSSKEPALGGIQIKVIENQGENVTTSLLELAEAGGIGLVLSIAVLFFFLRHWPSTLMVTLAIPICFVMTLGFMYFAGVTLNILSMMGLLLAVGMLVDNAVVVVESIYQERERMPDQPTLASIIGTRHVAIALSAGTLCHCIVFVPNLFGETQLPQHLPVADRDHHLGVAAGLVAGRGQPDPDAVGAHEDAAGGGRAERHHPAHAGPLRAVAALDAGARGWSVLGILLIIAVSIVPMKLTKLDMFGGDGGERGQHLLPVEGQLHQGADVGRGGRRSRSSSTPTASGSASTRSTRGTASRAMPARG